MRVFVELSLLLALLGCSGDRSVDPPAFGGPAPEPVEQGIVGVVEFWEGDHMPMPEGMSPDGSVQPVARTIYIHAATTNDDVVFNGEGGLSPFVKEIHTPRVATVRSGLSGEFAVALEPGTYSLFVGEAGLYYANLWSNEYIQPVTVESGEVRHFTIKIDYLAYY